MALSKVSWSIVFLTCGVLTYVVVPQKDGTIDWPGGSIAGMGVRLTAALLLCYLDGITSSIGINCVAIPLAVAFRRDGSIGGAL